MESTPMDVSQQLLCTPAQAAAMLGIGKTALYSYINDGSIRSIKVGLKARRIIVESLKDWIEQMEIEQSLY